MQIIIMRGLPGSGKTSWHKRFHPNAIVCSADDFHTVNGIYKFQPTNAGIAHRTCLRKYLEAFFTPSAATLIVDNTNTTLMELSRYVEPALAFGYDPRIVFMPCEIKESVRRNIHGVPPSTITKMYANLINEVLPPYWKQDFIYEGI